VADGRLADKPKLHLLLVTLGLSVFTAWADPPALAITTQPVSADHPAGQRGGDDGTASEFECHQHGPPRRWATKWLKDGVLLNGQTNSSVSFASFQFTNSGSYLVVITNTQGMVISLPAFLSVSNTSRAGESGVALYGRLMEFFGTAGHDSW
jgi:hypothetical protein